MVFMWLNFREMNNEIFFETAKFYKRKGINDTHVEELVLYWIQYKIHWNTRLAASDVFHLFTQWIKFFLIPLSCRCLKIVIHQIDSKNESLLLSVTFTAKLELVFVLTSENAFSWSFHFKAKRKSIRSSKKRY